MKINEFTVILFTNGENRPEFLVETAFVSTF